jgi:hypothetical protein
MGAQLVPISRFLPLQETYSTAKNAPQPNIGTTAKLLPKNSSFSSTYFDAEKVGAQRGHRH